MRISDWSSDVCSSDLYRLAAWNRGLQRICAPDYGLRSYRGPLRRYECRQGTLQFLQAGRPWACRSEEHTSELQSLMRISYAVFCLKKKKKKINTIVSTTYKKAKQLTIYLYRYENKT